MRTFFEETVPQMAFGVPRQEVEDLASLGYAAGFPSTGLSGRHHDKPIHSIGSQLAAQRFGAIPVLGGGFLREALQGAGSLATGKPFFSPPSYSLGRVGASDPGGFDIEDLMANVSGVGAALQQRQDPITNMLTWLLNLQDVQNPRDLQKRLGAKK
jgi:hypothetical protein